VDIKKLWGALADKLRADTGAGSLVTLTGHGVGAIRISLETPDLPAAYPRLVFSEGVTTAQIDEGPSVINRTIIRFTCKGSLSNVADILSRLKTLLDAEGALQHDGYYDISNDDVCNLWTQFLRMTEITHDTDIDQYSGTITARFIWREV
jgi:hypothetical protein